MLQQVDVPPKSLESYEPIVGGDTIDELRRSARPLKGLRLAHINATAYGGGVSELLHSLVPLYRSLGVAADWLVIPGTPAFFEVTKRIHNGLQGGRVVLSERARELYLEHTRQIAELIERRYDVVVVHDPQPAALRHFRGRGGARWVWRCHIDTSEPNGRVLQFLLPFLGDYDALVFTLDEFVPAPLRDERVTVIAPAIDPLSPKNLTLPTDIGRQIVQWAGIHVERPLLTQISRFDPWKDPLGVIEAFRLVRAQVPGTQLALLGQMALDDPQGWEMYRTIMDEAGADPDIHVLTNFTGVGNSEVNAFQSCSEVVLQKSLREGFGLVVSETLWKGTPVVAGRAGGIPLQLPEGTGGYLVDNVEQCAGRTVELLRDPRRAAQLGAAGQQHVREHFLITRLLADELRLLGALVAGAPAEPTAAARSVGQ